MSISNTQRPEEKADGDTKILIRSRTGHYLLENYYLQATLTR